MYVPDQFALDDPAQIAAILREHGFAVLVSAAGGQAPQATHLPFLYDPARGTRGTLLGHMARANPHRRDLARLAEAGGEALVVFSGPHAYVSPSWYAGGPAVPTWNYVAVHAYGTPRPIEDERSVRALLERLVAAHEAPLPRPWSMAAQDEAYFARMQRGIFAFEIPVARIEAKAKLNQNKTAQDRRGVVRALRAGGDPAAAAVAAWMDRQGLTA